MQDEAAISSLHHLPRHRRPARNISRSAFPEHDIIVFRRQAEAWADAFHILFCEAFAFFDVFDDVEAAAENEGSFFLLLRPVGDFAEGFVGRTAFSDELRKFFWLHGEGAVDAAVFAREREMLLDDGRAEGDAGDGGADAEGVVGEADTAAEEVAKMRERAKVRAGGARGVARRTLQERHVRAAVLACRAHEVVELGDGRHARGGDERLPRLRDLADERQVDVLERRDLVERRVERFEEVDGRRVERRAEAEDAAAFCVRENLCLPFPRRVRFLVQLVERLAVPWVLRVADEKLAVRFVDGHRVGRVGLQLDGVRAGLGRRFDDGFRAVERVVVVAAHFGDEEQVAVPAFDHVTSTSSNVSLSSPSACTSS